jgi:hypothetical protein
LLWKQYCIYVYNAVIWIVELFLHYSSKHICGALVNVLVSSTGDCGFKPWSGSN